MSYGGLGAVTPSALSGRWGREVLRLTSPGLGGSSLGLMPFASLSRASEEARSPSNEAAFLLHFPKLPSSFWPFY